MCHEATLDLAYQLAVSCRCDLVVHVDQTCQDDLFIPTGEDCSFIADYENSGIYLITDPSLSVVRELMLHG